MKIKLISAIENEDAEKVKSILENSNKNKKLLKLVKNINMAVIHF